MLPFLPLAQAQPVRLGSQRRLTPAAPHCTYLRMTSCRTLFLWYPQACLLTSLGFLPKCRFPREGFPIKKRKTSNSSSLPSAKNNAPHIKALTLLCLHSVSSRYVLACKFSVCVSQLEGGVSESLELLSFLLNPQNVDQRLL